MQTRIKQTLSALLVFTVLAGSIVSCKKDKDDNSNPNPGPNPGPAATVLQEYRNGDEFIKFEFNTDGTVKKATLKSDVNTNGNTVDYNITYNAQKKISELVTSAGEKIVPVYENGILSRADVFEGADRTGFTNYTYENNQLKRATIYWGQGTEFEPFLEFQFEYNAAGNVSKTIVLMATGQPGTLTRMSHVDFQYDNKTNPLLAYKDLFLLLWQSPSKNNIIQEDHFDENLQPEDRYTYTYTYKANGLPDHGEVKEGLPGGPITTTQFDFIYK
jgi:hypothetical protein